MLVDSEGVVFPASNFSHVDTSFDAEWQELCRATHSEARAGQFQRLAPAISSFYPFLV